MRAIQQYKPGLWDQEVQVPITLPPFPLAIHGRAACVDVGANGPASWADNFNCPDDYIELGSVIYEMNEDWQTITIEFTCPIDVTQVIIMQGCDLPEGMTSNSDTDTAYLNMDNVRFTSAYECSSVLIATEGSLCADDLILQAEAPAGTDNYQWFKDGVAIPEQNNTFLEISDLDLGAGLYQFRLFLDGVCSLIEYEVEQYEWPDFSVFIEPSVGCVPLAVDFSSSFNGMQDYSFEWSFGDGNESEIADPANVYIDIGTYDISLEIQVSNGCVIDTIIEDAVLVSAPPLVQFSSDVTSVCVGEQIQFSNDAAESINCTWIIGNAIESSECSPVIQFSEEGIYDVTLSLEFEGNCTANETLEEMILVHPSPSAFFETDPLCNLDLAAEFTVTEVAPGLNVDNTWYYGDGSEGIVNNHLYDNPGIYEVSHVVISEEGCSDSTIVTQVVSPLELELNYSETQGCSPHEVSFFPITTTYWDDLSNLNYLWEMNGAEFMDNDNVIVSFENSGHLTSQNYSVSLMVTDPYGCSETIVLEDLVEVWPNPSAEFSMLNTEPASNGVEVTFQNESTGGDDYLWDFGDGMTSAVFEPVHTFVQNLEESTISLWTYNEHGCSDSTLINISIDSPISIYIPNAFTPDGDGINDIFRIRSIGNLSPYTLEIFNRWGELVYESQNQQDGWIGNHQNGDYYVPDGIYTYRVSYGNHGQVLDVIYGNVSILR